MIGTAGRLVGHFIHNGATIQASFANAAEFFNSLLDSVWAANRDRIIEATLPTRDRLHNGF
ncbi:hypothetical protein JQ615_41440 [Bradyrhizobium jicamae]|uniref:Uncharacterized protein n=1 Tax=Bradyrhizobium jicamae TaxID=280332 RepID=A0ABS5FY95_9BRAD|nr:hypothetical protein [Bradyrhizobium jicamae]